MGDGRREGGKRDSQGASNWEKLSKISQFFIIFCKRNMGPRGRNHYGKVQEAGGSCGVKRHEFVTSAYRR